MKMCPYGKYISVYNETSGDNNGSWTKSGVAFDNYKRQIVRTRKKKRIRIAEV